MYLARYNNEQTMARSSHTTHDTTRSDTVWRRSYTPTINSCSKIYKRGNNLSIFGRQRAYLETLNVFSPLERKRGYFDLKCSDERRPTIRCTLNLGRVINNDSASIYPSLTCKLPFPIANCDGL